MLVPFSPNEASLARSIPFPDPDPPVAAARVSQSSPTLVSGAVYSPLAICFEQMFPPTAPTSKPGMIMGMVLASVPTLGKVLGEEVPYERSSY